ncbi:unnamed protein product [Orchesella dallaii]|uniref:Chloride channel protein n=1 Tax=Orchesella dallaii TaxID=48710 RepID=A0ABP1QBL5_9HEXA
MEQDQSKEEIAEEFEINNDFVTAGQEDTFPSRSQVFLETKINEDPSFFRSQPISYFSKGKDFQKSKEVHQHTSYEKKVLNTFESIPTYPCHTAVYKAWLKKNSPFKSNGESWLFISIIGILMGIIAFSIKLTVEKLYIFQHPIMETYVKRGEVVRLWFYYCSMSCFFSVIASFIVVYVCPSTAGSGMPELMAILNGVAVRKMLSIKVLFWKILSSSLSILSTLPVGFEGPMIHIGSMVPTILTAPYKCCANMSVPENRYANDNVEGSRVSRFCLRMYTRIRSDLCRLRDGRERQVLACIGAASGVAAALNAPITGLCFSMEEMSSQWNNSLTWQTFFSCILACSTTELLNIILSNYEKQVPHPIDYTVTEVPLFDTTEKLRTGISSVVPAIGIGIIGGLLASMFIAMHMKITRFKKYTFERLNRQTGNALKILDTFIITVLFTTIVILILPIQNCRTIQHTQLQDNIESKPMELHAYACEAKLQVSVQGNNSASTVSLKGEYHEIATLFFNTWEQLIRNLFTRRTHDFFSVSALSLTLGILFLFSSFAGSASVSAGLMIPQLAIGAVYGRILGQSFYNLIEISGGDPVRWGWVDPGLFAMLGSASFFAGTSRLPITSVIMMIEMTNDVNFVFLIMVCVLTSKFIGDQFTHSLYHSLIELKCMPFLEPELRIYWEDKRVNLELFEVGDVMAEPVQCVRVIETVQNLAEVLTTSQHGGYPVVKGSEEAVLGLIGIISRMEIIILLCNLDMEDVDLDVYGLRAIDIERLHTMYSQYSRDPKVLKNYEAINKLLNIYLLDARYKDLYINLVPYVDTSTFKITKSFSLERSYNIFRQMGLRHLVVVDDDNQVIGMITRKDLLGSEIEKKIHHLIKHSMNRTFGAYDHRKDNISGISVVIHEAESNERITETEDQQQRVSTV